jgi:hypothetical protein
VVLHRLVRVVACCVPPQPTPTHARAGAAGVGGLRQQLMRTRDNPAMTLSLKVVLGLTGTRGGCQPGGGARAPPPPGQGSITPAGQLRAQPPQGVRGPSPHAAPVWLLLPPAFCRVGRVPLRGRQNDLRLSGRAAMDTIDVVIAGGKTSITVPTQLSLSALVATVRQSLPADAGLAQEVRNSPRDRMCTMTTAVDAAWRPRSRPSPPAPSCRTLC